MTRRLGRRIGRAEGFPLGEHLVAALFEVDFYGHVDLNGFDFDAIDVAVHADVLIKRDDGVDVGHVLIERGMAGLPHDNEAVDAALAADGYPLEVVREAVGIALTGIEEAVATGSAALDGESALFGGLPERLCDLIGIRNRLGYRLPLCHYPTPPNGSLPLVGGTYTIASIPAVTR